MKRETLIGLLKKYNVKIAYIFGSQKESGIAFLNDSNPAIDERADLDIGVVFEKLPMDTFGVYGELYADLSILFEPFNVDLVFLQETNMLFQYEAIKGEFIYCEDESFLDEYEEMVMKTASDLSFNKLEFERDFIEAIKDGYFEITHREG
jgi:predicted nucleotidyltransferase